jgi:indolepyruvate ferredoxin oxidoreductase
VLALAADDHNCRSSTLPHGSEHEFVSAMMPVLNPAGVQDILDMGLLGFAMSRFTGRWVGFKTIAETVESSASVDVDPFALQIVLPGDAEFEMPAGGLNIRWPDPPLDQEMRLHRYAVKAAQAFARANGIDRIVIDSPNARLGIVTTGKSYLDVLQALEYLGPRRRRLPRPRHPRVQGRHDLAAGTVRASARSRAGCRTSWWSRKSTPSSSRR